MRLLKVREFILVFLTHKIALPMLRFVRRPNAFTYSEEELKMLPAGTLGNDLYVFLKERNSSIAQYKTLQTSFAFFRCIKSKQNMLKVMACIMI